MHQPEHLPWLGFFDKMRQCDVFVLLDTVQFAKRDFQNRNRVKGRDGVVWLTVPVASKGKFEQRIESVSIVNDRDWRRKCWTTLYHAYGSAPHFEEHRAFFEDLYRRDWSRLVALNRHIIDYVAAALGLRTRLVTASELGVYERGGTNVILSACRALGADVYLSGVFGRRYLDAAAFEEQAVEVRYQRFHHPVYPQLWGAFVPRMAAVDLLFNCGSVDLSRMATGET